ncbi:MAG: hypothetical protein AB7P34_21920 [Vicinamibacterales bacterium]
MMRTLSATAVAISLSLTTAAAQAPQTTKPQTESATAQAQARNLMQDVTKVGCLKAWQPAPTDAARAAEPAKMGTYVLTPLSVDPVKATVDLPTYVLVGGATVNFAAHQNHKVEISGVEQTAQMPPTPQETVNAPNMKAENKPDLKTLPSLTVRSLKMLSTSCS